MDNKPTRGPKRFSRYASNDNRPTFDWLRALSLFSMWFCVFIGLFLWFKVILFPYTQQPNQITEEAYHVQK